MARAHRPFRRSFRFDPSGSRRSILASQRVLSPRVRGKSAEEVEQKFFFGAGCGIPRGEYEWGMSQAHVFEE